MNAFSDAIKAENARGLAAVIPDIKCYSPKEGDLLRGRDPVVAARLLAACGAPAISVVTEQAGFGGSPELLKAVVKATGLPVLRKDFITDKTQLEETAALGASAVLIICSIMDDETVAFLCEEARRLKLEPLVETHTRAELKLAERLGAKLVGINNREIATLELDDGGPARTAALMAYAPENAVVISESGVRTPADARLAAGSGANAILVGTALWKAEDMAAAYRSLRVTTGGKACAPS